MSYEIRKTDDGASLVMPLELPIFEGWNSDLGKQACLSLNSFLRHSAIYDWIDSNLDMDEPSIADAAGQEKAMAASQLISTMMSLMGMADNLGIDIMQEIWEMPWQV